jgi:hypothetical protein
MTNVHIQRQLWKKVDANRARVNHARERDEREAQAIRLLNRQTVDNQQTGSAK